MDHQLAQSAMHTTKSHLARCYTAHSGLGPPSSIINQGNAPAGLPTGSPMEAFSQLRFLFPDNSSLSMSAYTCCNRGPLQWTLGLPGQAPCAPIPPAALTAATSSQLPPSPFADQLQKTTDQNCSPYLKITEARKSTDPEGRQTSCDFPVSGSLYLSDFN